MRRTGAGLALAVTAAAALAAAKAFAAPGSEEASPGCSKATATQLIEQNRLNHFALPNPVRQVLCGPFTGPGSTAMAVTIGAPTCWGIQHWAVFTSTGSAWRLVLDQPAYLMPPLVAVGSGIRETTAVHRSGDSRCFPRGGTRARIWRWNGSRLVAGPWKQVTKGEAESKAFWSPSRNIACGMFDEASYRYVRCQSGIPQQMVTLDANGRVTICRNRGGEGRCFGAYTTRASLRVSGVVHHGGFIQCGDDANGDPSRTSGLYRFSGPAYPSRSKLARVPGQVAIDESSSSSQRGWAVTWTVLYEGKPLCSETVVWSGARPSPRMLDCTISPSVSSGAFDVRRLRIQQVASPASSGSLWAGLLRPTIVVEVPRG